MVLRVPGVGSSSFLFFHTTELLPMISRRSEMALDMSVLPVIFECGKRRRAFIEMSFNAFYYINSTRPRSTS
jgi:hypothetical protein